MSSYESEALVLAGLCQRCGGRCCAGHYILLSKSECRRLSDYMDFPRKKIDSPTGCAMEGIDALHGGKCPFLGVYGCVLSARSRPLVCRMFPVTYTCDAGVVRFHLSKKCPHIDSVKRLTKWVAETRREAEEELRKDWTGKELRCFGNYLKKDADELIDL